MMELLTTIFTGVLGGGATGLLGVLLQRYFDNKKVKADIELTRLQLEAALKTRQTELEAQERMAGRAADAAALQATLEAQTREAEAAERSYQASVQADRATYIAPAAQEHSRVVRWAMGLVDAVRGLMRPGITAYTLYLLTAVMLWVRDLYVRTGLQMTPEQLHRLAMDTVGTIFYLATTCVVWWFGVRPAQPQPRK